MFVKNNILVLLHNHESIEIYLTNDKFCFLNSSTTQHSDNFRTFQNNTCFLVCREKHNFRMFQKNSDFLFVEKMT